MSPDAAKKFVDLALRQSGEWDALLLELQGSCDPEEFKALRSIVANVLGNYYFEILQPFLTEYPSLGLPGLFDD
jgi:hypothetical protein